MDHAMQRYVDGDLAAFDELYASLAPRIYGYLLQLVRDRAHADDLLQVTFMKLHSARGAWARGAPVLPWALRIARNAAYDDFRSRNKARVVLTTTGVVPDRADGADDGEPAGPLVDALHESMAHLPQAYREALTLTKQLDLSMREAATVAGTTETAMKLRVHRAYKQLRDDLGHLRRPQT